MRVAIYHPWVYLRSGLERTILELARRSRHDWTIYTSHFDPDGTYPELRSMNVVELARVSVRRRYGTVIRAAWRIARTRLDPSTYDALVICCDGLGSLLTLRNHERRTICLCFTPLRAVYDEEYRARHLRAHRWKLPAALLFERVYRIVDRAAWKRYDRVLCISRTVRDRVVRGGLRPESDIEIAHPGVATERIVPCFDSERYFFLPGRIMWTKNIELGIDAFRAFAARNAGWRLVIAGMVDEKSRAYEAALRERVAGAPIEFVIAPDDARMEELYRGCYAVLFTAFNEDLGLTPIEAMAHGKPVIAVNRGGPTEVVLDGETGFLAECDAGDFAAALDRLAADPPRAREMGGNAVVRAKGYSWNRFVEAVDLCVEGALAPDCGAMAMREEG
jgi:glycosyltransferase involved in cell wall biosynthesis